MLVLTRKVNETIMIGSDVAITVVSVQGHGARAQIRLGISAPRELPVMRREVYDASRVEREREASAEAPEVVTPAN